VGTLSEWSRVKKEVRQGCPFSILVQHPSGDGIMVMRETHDFNVDYK